MKRFTLVELLKPEIEISIEISSEDLKKSYEFLNNSDYIVSINRTPNFLFHYIDVNNNLKQIPIASTRVKLPFLLKQNYKFISFYCEEENKIKLTNRTIRVATLNKERLHDFKCEAKNINRINFDI